MSKKGLRIGGFWVPLEHFNDLVKSLAPRKNGRKK
jgi:hypothetical protein